MKKVLVLALILAMLLPAGIMNVCAASTPQFEYNLTFSDASGNIVTSAKKGDTLTGTLTLTRTDIADGSTYRLRGVDIQFEYPKGDGLDVSFPESDYTQIIGTQKDGNIGNSSFRCIYMDQSWKDTATEGVFEIEGIEVSKSFTLGRFTVKIGDDAVSSYTFIPKINEIYISGDDRIGDNTLYKAIGDNTLLTITDSSNNTPWTGTTGSSGNGSSGSTGSSGTGTGTDPTTTVPAVTTPQADVSLASSVASAYISGYDEDKDGVPELVKPNSNISRAEVAAIFDRLLSSETKSAYAAVSADFSDISEADWFNKPVATLANCGILNGSDVNNDGIMEFRPNDKITRAELTVIVSKFADAAGSESVNFSDIAGHWAESYITKAASKGWIKGSDIDNDGVAEFRPDDTVTRAETAAIINRIIGRTADAADASKLSVKVFKDNSDSTEWYYNDIQLAANEL